MDSFFTTGQAARQTGYPEWLIRRVADELFNELPRFAAKRVLTKCQVAEIAAVIAGRRREAAASA